MCLNKHWTCEFPLLQVAMCYVPTFWRQAIHASKSSRTVALCCKSKSSLIFVLPERKSNNLLLYYVGEFVCFGRSLFSTPSQCPVCLITPKIMGLPSIIYCTKDERRVSFSLELFIGTFFAPKQTFRKAHSKCTHTHTCLCIWKDTVQTISRKWQWSQYSRTKKMHFCTQFIMNYRPVHVSSTICSTSGGAA
jgi:hypothetical protein